jgi:hypothetical protein
VLRIEADRRLEDKKIMAEKNNNIASAAYGSDMWDDDDREVNNNDDDLDAMEQGEAVHVERPIIIMWQLLAGSFDDLGTDELSHIFGFLPFKILCLLV